MKKKQAQHTSERDPLIKVLSTFRRTDMTSFEDAWVGIEPTFQSAKSVDVERAPKLDAALDSSMLTTEASYENRAQMGRTSARDFVEALLLTIHRARYLKANPSVRVKDSLLHDQLLIQAEATVKKYLGNAALERLKAKARKSNREYSKGRLKMDWIEPETLF